jgi:hypothetical protein
VKFSLVVGALLAAGAIGCLLGIWVYHPPGERWFRRVAVGFAVAAVLAVLGGAIAQAF